jgi:hypothetical protein
MREGIWGSYSVEGRHLIASLLRVITGVIEQRKKGGGDCGRKTMALMGGSRLAVRERKG